MGGCNNNSGQILGGHGSSKGCGPCDTAKNSCGAPLLFFANALYSLDEGTNTGYLNNSGGGDVSPTPRNYPIGKTTTLSKLAVHVSGTGVFTGDEELVATVTKNGVATDLTVTFDASNLTAAASTRTRVGGKKTTFKKGDLVDIQVVVSSGGLGSGTVISASLS